MKIISLMDNVAKSDRFVSRHGLSFYIETGTHKILFDAGPDDAFLENAELLGIDLTQVDIAVLSHGHYDHGGGLEAFLRVNSRSKVHVHRMAFGGYFAHDPDKIRYIGLPDSLKDSDRIIFHSEDTELAPGIRLFSGVTGRELFSPGNATLFMDKEGTQVHDIFDHEQNLLITEGEESILIAGCAHNGIVNILEKAKTISDKPVTKVFGGMHLKGTPDLPAFADKLAMRLKEESCVFYTCHCTGTEGYLAMKNVLGEQMKYFAAGRSICLNKN